MSLIIPQGYKPKLGVRKTEDAILKIKNFFQARLSENLNLQRVSAPPFVRAGTGINDDLNGTERKVDFDLGEDGTKVEIVQSLAKWKRLALARYGYSKGEGIWTDMNAIRRDEERDNIHSIYVDQWDWEKVISEETRDEELLRFTVNMIYDAIKKTERMVFQEYDIPPVLPGKIRFVDTKNLEQAHPSLSRKDREHVSASSLKALFLMKIGWPLKDSKPHDGRAPDYDDWNLNGDIIVWNPILGQALELSSMGIRVDRDTLIKQLEASDNTDRLGLDFHRKLIEGELPLSIGGGIGQSRLCMFLLRKAHIGEVQVGEWPNDTVLELQNRGIALL